jgi:hypothetical protein
MVRLVESAKGRHALDEPSGPEARQTNQVLPT